MTDTTTDIHCPACGKPMKKIKISKKNFNIDLCLNGCGGIFFDNQELKSFDEKDENIDELMTAIEGKTFDKTDESVTRICPCGHNMVKKYSSVKQEIQIDDCYICGGKFLDHEELLKIRSEYDTEDKRKEAGDKHLDDLFGHETKPLSEKAAAARRYVEIIKMIQMERLKHAFWHHHH